MAHRARAPATKVQVHDRRAMTRLCAYLRFFDVEGSGTRCPSWPTAENWLSLAFHHSRDVEDSRLGQPGTGADLEYDPSSKWIWPEDPGKEDYRVILLYVVRYYVRPSSMNGQILDVAKTSSRRCSTTIPRYRKEFPYNRSQGAFLG